MEHLRAVLILLTSRSLRLTQCESVKENSAAFFVHLGRVFFPCGQTEGWCWYGKDWAHNTCFPAYRQVGPSRTAGSLAVSLAFSLALRIPSLLYNSPHLFVGDTFQDSQWMLETVDSTKPDICYVFSYISIPVIKFNL